jgi:putative ABC transport system permease protein
LPGRFGSVRFTVGGIWRAPDGVGRSVTMTDVQFLSLTGPRPPNWVLLEPVAGTTPAALARHLRDNPLGAGLKILDPDEQGANYSREFASFLDPFWALQRAMLLTAFVATLSTLLLAAAQRRREHGLLGAIGMPPGDLARMTITEGGLIGLAATVLGGVNGLLLLTAFTWASPVTTGLPLPLHVSLVPLFVAGVIATLITVAGSAIPAWRISRIDPAAVLRYE